jgi:hypothetical protein
VTDCVTHSRPHRRPSDNRRNYTLTG